MSCIVSMMKTNILQDFSEGFVNIHCSHSHLSLSILSLACLDLILSRIRSGYIRIFIFSLPRRKDFKLKQLLFYNLSSLLVLNLRFIVRVVPQVSSEFFSEVYYLIAAFV